MTQSSINPENLVGDSNSREPDSNQTVHKRMLVQCNDVFKIYKQNNLEVFALRGLNLTIYEGEIVVVMGPSGSGKTTLLHIIAGLEKCSAGFVKFKDLDIGRLKDTQIEHLLQNEIGIVFQNFNLINTLTVYGNIELPMIIANVKSADQVKRVKKLLKDVKLEKFAFSRPFNLSGGERQRVAIAMALANNPTLILADEPTGNLDSENSNQILELFQRIIETNLHKSIVIVTHNEIFKKIANRILTLKDGAILSEEGPFFL